MRKKLLAVLSVLLLSFAPLCAEEGVGASGSLGAVPPAAAEVQTSAETTEETAAETATAETQASEETTEETPAEIATVETQASGETTEETTAETAMAETQASGETAEKVSAEEITAKAASDGTEENAEEPVKLTRKQKKEREKQAKEAEKALLASMTSEERREYKKQKAIAEQKEWDAAPFHFDFTIDTGIAFVRGSDVAPFVGFSWGVEAHVYGARFYGLAQIMTQPGGSDGGGNAVGEFMTEGGMRLSWKLFGDQNTISHFTVDVGFYAQHVEIPAVSNTYYRMHNGFIIRPAISTTVFRHKLWQTEIGVGYQKTIFPAYDDYDGVVVFMRLF